MESGDLKLRSVLQRSKELGFLGPGPIDEHISHAAGFAEVAAAALSEPPRHVVDLGSGGGIPGLVLAVTWTANEIILVDGSTKRCEFLESAVEELDIAERVSVRCGRAEELAHEDDLRGWADLVVARSFASPPVTAECAAGFLRAGGHLVVSEPPELSVSERWDAAGLRAVGMGDVAPQRRDANYVVITQLSTCDQRFPRRVGVPAKRPLF